ncbi:hypothetical protein [Eastern grey kangaroopox virus]|uniref:Uncharacterized protein n=1 Tax=Eastern grey kangaroopox virus TaxID=2042482 RepID=A0A2C9DSX1_9POXV|nr:hypothetical protein KM541_gp008 [Eastern grey kangaroopox virus]ATI21104.1 hypothetical protein [Eastern grey kangaroopox virus]ATX75008.1 hypothetical protein EKPV-NSW-ORF013 [Eastern grey kangaroopox virus]
MRLRSVLRAVMFSVFSASVGVASYLLIRRILDELYRRRFRLSREDVQRMLDTMQRLVDEREASVPRLKMEELPSSPSSSLHSIGAGESENDTLGSISRFSRG